MGFTLLLGSLSINLGLDFEFNDNFDDKNGQFELNTSGFWNLPYIHIDNNWTYTAGNYSWVSGTGTWNDPFVIENVIIDGGTLGISIENSKKYFILRNNTVSNVVGVIGAGIWLNAVTNGSIYNNNVSNNVYGVYLSDNCENNTISNNFLFKDMYGIQINGFSTKYNKFTDNVILNSSINGIYDLGGESNYYARNTIMYTIQEALYWEGCTNNTFTDNLVKWNGYGIFINPASDNYFYRNFFVENTQQVYITFGSTNYWNSSLIGNYWSNYTGSDLDGNGIGDTEHWLPKGNRDYLPIWDEIAPNITINSPIVNQTIGTIAPDFNIRVNEVYLDTMWYSLDTGITNIPFTSNGTISQNLWKLIPDGSVTIRFYANDSLG